MMRVYEYDYDRRLVTEYERRGGCNQCGDCCRAEIAFAVQGLPENAEHMAGGPATDGTGVWQCYDAGDGPRCYKIKAIMPDQAACPAQGPDDRCTVYADRNAYCRLWPLVPSDIAAFPRCSYSFVAVWEWPLTSDPDHESADG